MNNIEYISLLIDNDEVVNGLGESRKIADVIKNWAKDLKIFQSHVAVKHFPENYSFFIPDFWHITYGRAKCLPNSEAKELWESASQAREIAESLSEYSKSAQPFSSNN